MSAHDNATSVSHRFHGGGPTSDLVNTVAELIRQTTSPTATARTVIEKVRGVLERDGVAGDDALKVALLLIEVDRDALTTALRQLCAAYSDANMHGAFATNGAQTRRLAALHDAYVQAADLLDEVAA